MIAKVALLLAALAVIDAAVVAPGILAPGVASTQTIVSIPGAVSTDSRIIGAPGIIGASPLLLNGGLIGSPIGLASGILAPGVILKK
ncbi:hypothetical protein AVEN_137074-1 [Araneus ventricosus]|uniref:Uncharacterized protein n=1 Tax=Araneus ventricosus TaxID=182803 RepID=A0A4Y2M0X1_ARAVE|nr:hypothetical protein AVEN_137074-1 [Araneus ventricosus]